MKKSPWLSIVSVLTAFCMLFPSIPAKGECLEVSTPEMILSESAMSSIYYPTTNSYCYDHLSESGKELYQNLLTSCLEVENSSSNYEITPLARRPMFLSDNELSDIVSIFLYDHPEFFWIGKTFAKRGLSYVYLDIYEQYQDGTARNQARTEMMNGISVYIDEALQKSTDYERAYYLANMLKTNTIYSTTEKLSQSMISVFAGRKKTVCAGLTKAYSYLCNAVGIHAISMVGVNHAWNMVELNGNWYYVDVTNGLYFLTRGDLLNTNFARSNTGYTNKYPNQQDVYDENGNIKMYGVYDSRYYCYDNIFPESAVPYSFNFVTMQERNEPTVKKFIATNQTNYYLMESNQSILLDDLISEFYRTTEYENGDIISRDDLSIDNFIIKEGWQTPKEVYAHREEGENYYHGGIPCTFGDIEMVIGDLWIGVNGDCDLDGIPTAADAATVLIYAASMGAGDSSVTLSPNDSIPEDFVHFIVNQDNSSRPTADTASRILILAAKNGAGA